MRAQIVFDRIGDIVVSCSTGSLALPDVCKLADELADEGTHFYVAGATGDVALDPASRNLLYDLLRKRGIRVLAVSDSKVVRGIITAATWMGVSVQAKSWSDIETSRQTDDSMGDRRALDLLLRQRRACENSISTDA